MGDEDSVLLGLEGRQIVVAFDLRLIVNSKSLSDLHKMIRHFLVTGIYKIGSHAQLNITKQ